MRALSAEQERVLRIVVTEDDWELEDMTIFWDDREQQVAADLIARRLVVQRMGPDGSSSYHPTPLAPLALRVAVQRPAAGL